MGKLGVPLAVVRWLLAGEKLDSAHDESHVETRPGFWRWLFSSEELPEVDSSEIESKPTGLLRLIFTPEQLPQVTLGAPPPSSQTGEPGRTES